MARPYNLTNISDSNNLWEMTKATNDVVGGDLMKLVFVGVWIVFFFAFKKNYDTKRSFAGASFILSITGIFFRLMNFIPDVYMFGAFILAGIGFIMLKFED